MNDKQQLAAMGEHLAEQAEQAAQPMCMAKRIEELEAQVRVMGGALNEFRDFSASNVWDDAERGALLASIDAALAGKLPTQATLEGWQLVPVELTDEMVMAAVSKDPGLFRHQAEDLWSALLAAAPKPEAR